MPYSIAAILETEQPYFPDIYYELPTSPVVGHKVRIYDHEDWFVEGTVLNVSGTYAHVDFGDWKQSFEISKLSYVNVDFCIFMIAAE